MFQNIGFNIKQIYIIELLFPLKSIENHRFPNAFGRNGNWLIYSSLLNTEKKKIEIFSKSLYKLSEKQVMEDLWKWDDFTAFVRLQLVKSSVTGCFHVIL